MKIECIVFDMAGTTINEDNIVYKTLHQSILEHGVSLSLENVLEHGAGKEKLNAIEDILSIYGDDSQKAQSKIIFNNFLHYLEDAYNHFPVKPTNNAEKVLRTIRKWGIKVVLNTGYDRHTANKLLNKIDWVENDQYDLLVTASEVENARPFPDMIILAMKKLSISASQKVVKIGDSAIDIEEGKNANCILNIGVTTGAQTFEQIAVANPDYIIKDLIDLLAIVEEYNQVN